MKIPYQQIPAPTLRKLIESFVMREGTDYGHNNYQLDKKVDQVMNQLKRGVAIITFNPEDESFNIVAKT